MKKTALILALVASGAFAQPTPDSIALAKLVPIADIHMHTYEYNGRSPRWWREQMDANNVKWGGAVGDYREDVQAELKERYIPALGQNPFYKVFLNNGANGLVDSDNFKELFAQAEKLFQAGKIKGFGEFHTDNHTSSRPSFRRIIRTDNPVIRNAYAIANKYNGFVQIHAEFDSVFEQDILNLSADFPNVTTVLSHCLSTSDAKVVGSLFSKRKNITCEMSATGSAQYKIVGLNKPPKAFDSAGPFKDWKTLIETYPDQVMLGSDPCCGADKGYAELISELRINLLPYFSPSIIEKVAYKNAVRVFGLKD